MSAPAPFLIRPDMLIGQQYRVKGWSLITMLSCGCHPDAPVMVLANGTVATCPLCHKSFAYSKFTHDFQRDQGQIEIANVVVSARNGPETTQ